MRRRPPLRGTGRRSIGPMRPRSFHQMHGFPAIRSSSGGSEPFRVDAPCHPPDLHLTATIARASLPPIALGPPGRGLLGRPSGPDGICAPGFSPCAGFSSFYYLFPEAFSNLQISPYLILSNCNSVLNIPNNFIKDPILFHNYISFPFQSIFT